MAFINRDRDTRQKHQQRVDALSAATVNPDDATPGRRRSALLGRLSRIRQPISTGQSNGHRNRGL
jgi:hypothetical protein